MISASLGSTVGSGHVMGVPTESELTESEITCLDETTIEEDNSPEISPIQVSDVSNDDSSLSLTEEEENYARKRTLMVSEKDEDYARKRTLMASEKDKDYAPKSVLFREEKTLTTELPRLPLLQKEEEAVSKRISKEAKGIIKDKDGEALGKALPQPKDVPPEPSIPMVYSKKLLWSADDGFSSIELENGEALKENEISFRTKVFREGRYISPRECASCKNPKCQLINNGKIFRKSPKGCKIVCTVCNRNWASTPIVNKRKSKIGQKTIFKGKPYKCKGCGFRAFAFHKGQCSCCRNNKSCKDCGSGEHTIDIDKDSDFSKLGKCACGSYDGFIETYRCLKGEKKISVVYVHYCYACDRKMLATYDGEKYTCFAPCAKGLTYQHLINVPKDRIINAIINFTTINTFPLMKE